MKHNLYSAYKETFTKLHLLSEFCDIAILTKYYTLCHIYWFDHPCNLQRFDKNQLAFIYLHTQYKVIHILELHVN